MKAKPENALIAKRRLDEGQGVPPLHGTGNREQPCVMDEVASV